MAVTIVEPLLQLFHRFFCSALPSARNGGAGDEHTAAAETMALGGAHRSRCILGAFRCSLARSHFLLRLLLIATEADSASDLEQPANCSARANCRFAFRSTVALQTTAQRRKRTAFNCLIFGLPLSASRRPFYLISFQMCNSVACTRDRRKGEGKLRSPALDGANEADCYEKWFRLTGKRGPRNISRDNVPQRPRSAAAAAALQHKLLASMFSLACSADHFPARDCLQLSAEQKLTFAPNSKRGRRIGALRKFVFDLRWILLELLCLSFARRRREIRASTPL